MLSVAVRCYAYGHGWREVSSGCGAMRRFFVGMRRQRQWCDRKRRNTGDNERRIAGDGGDATIDVVSGSEQRAVSQHYRIFKSAVSRARRNHRDKRRFGMVGCERAVRRGSLLDRSHARHIANAGFHLAYDIAAVLFERIDDLDR